MSSAAAVLRSFLAKSTHGEGSRGGHIIGHTRTGQAIYASHRGDSAEYAGLTPSDHAAAAMLHDLEADRNQDNLRVAAHHTAMADSHRAYHQRAVERFHATGGGKDKKKFGYKLGNLLPPENPKPEDGHPVDKTFVGRVIYSHREPHVYEQMTAAEFGDASRIHGTAAKRAEGNANEDGRKHHEDMRYKFVQAAFSQAKLEQKLLGQEDWRFGQRHQRRR